MLSLLERVTKEKLIEIKNLDPKTELVDLDFKLTFSIKGGPGIEIAKDIAAFANTKGGYIIFGVSNDYQWIGLNDESDVDIDEAKITQLCEKYIDGRIEFVYSIHELEDREFLILYINPSVEINPFKIIGQYERGRSGKVKCITVFKEGDVYCRRGSRSIKADNLFYKQKRQNFRVVHNLPSPPFHDFIGRESQVVKTHELLIHPNTRLLQVDGIGGIGKTSLVYYYCKSLIEKKLKHNFDFIIWMSGKRTVFTPSGEMKIKSFIASYRDVITEIAQFLGEGEIPANNLKEISVYVDVLLKQHNTLLVVDNMETLIEEDLITFLFNLPSNVKAILTTRESIGNFQMSTMTLKGFDKDKEFEDFLELEYHRRKEESFIKRYVHYLDLIYIYTRGMPLALQLITNQLAFDVDIKYIVKKLESGKTYESLLGFCFKGSIEKLDELQQKILYILSIPESEEFISVEELCYITGNSDDEIIPALQKLSTFSLCYKDKTFDDKTGYASPHLTKVYVRQYEFKNKNEIIQNYEKYINERSQIALTDEQYIIKSRANNHEHKIAALKVKNIMSIFYFEGFDRASKILNEVIKSHPDFAYLYFLRAIIEKEASFYKSFEEARISFSKATNHDPKLIDAWIEWGYLEQESKQWPLSKQYFEQALNLDVDNPRANHGYARTLSMISNAKKDKAMAIEAIKYFKKGYYLDSHENQQKHSNAINAHAYAKHLVNALEEYDNALEICEQGIKYEPKNERLLTLRGEIKKIIKDRANKNIIESKQSTSFTQVTTVKIPDSINLGSIPPSQKSINNIGTDKFKRNSTILDNLPPDIVSKLKKLQ